MNFVTIDFVKFLLRGGDIDYIEIKTDDDEKESVSKRKTCNYRVSMNKGGEYSYRHQISETLYYVFYLCGHASQNLLLTSGRLG